MKAAGLYYLTFDSSPGHMKFYHPNSVRSETLNEAISKNTPFVVTTDDHEYGFVVWWDEYEPHEKEKLFTLADTSAEEQEKELVKELSNWDDGNLHIEDALNQLVLWDHQL